MSEAEEPRKGLGAVEWVAIVLGIVVIAGVFLWHFRLFLRSGPLWLGITLFVGVPVVLAILLALLCLRDADKTPGLDRTDGESEKTKPAQWGVVALTIALTAGAILYRWLMHIHLGHSAAMFLGIPAVLAILLAFTPQAKTVTGGILKGITLMLLIVAPLLGEGYLCILIASPLFYVVGIVIGAIADSLRKKRTTTLSCAALVLLPMCLEGTVPQLAFPRHQTVEAVRIVDASAASVETALSQSLDVRTPLPGLLGAGFPRPLEAHGDGLVIGTTRTIHFSGAEGDPPGDLIVRIAERRPGYVRFEAIGDTSKLTQWIAWGSSEVEWRQIDPAHTKITCRIRFERRLDPAWYFTPIERATVHEAAKYLIEAGATPRNNTQHGALQ